MVGNRELMERFGVRFEQMRAGDSTATEGQTVDVCVAVGGNWRAAGA